MREGRRVDEEDNAKEKHQNLPFGILNPDDRIVECGEDQDAGEDLVWPLDDDVGEKEGLPAVSFARPFSDFVK